MKSINLDDEDTNIGNILLRLGAVTRDQLQAAVLEQHMVHDERKRLGEILIKRGDIDETMLSHALEVQTAERAGDAVALVGTLGKFVDAVAHRAQSLNNALTILEDVPTRA